MVVAAVLVLSAAPVQAAEGFRGVPWGRSREEVVARLGEHVMKRKDYLAYRDTIAGYEVLAMCMFSDDVLVGGMYALSEDFVNSNRYLEAYDRFAELLERSTGPRSSTAMRGKAGASIKTVRSTGGWPSPWDTWNGWRTGRRPNPALCCG